MPRHVVAAAAEIAPGASRLVTIGQREIAIFNVGGSFHAIANRCPHEGASLCAGRVVALVEANEPGHYKVSRHGELVRCPWHGWEFDIRTGQSWCDPTRVKVRAFDVAVERGGALAEGPYVVETYPVAVEQDYLVIEIA
jgi:3-phenylpropionate/trans-cinnamate dioxygenase ferredoxin subunit